jgi:hypothetical protein
MQASRKAENLITRHDMCPHLKTTSLKQTPGRGSEGSKDKRWSQRSDDSFCVDVGEVQYCSHCKKAGTDAREFGALVDRGSKFLHEHINEGDIDEGAGRYGGEGW